MATPTPQVLDDVQSGAPGEALHSTQLELAQVTRQGLQLIGAPLPPVEKHVETRGVPCLACTLRSWVTPGTSVPKAWTQWCPGANEQQRPLGQPLGRQSWPSSGREKSILGAARGLTSDQWPGPLPHTKRLSSPPTDILHILPSQPPQSPHRGDGLSVWGCRGPGKKVQLFPGLFAKISFQRRKMCCPRSNSGSPP